MSRLSITRTGGRTDPAVRMAQLATEIIIALIWIPLCSLSNRRANPMPLKRNAFSCWRRVLAAIVGQPPSRDRCLGIAARSVSHCGKKRQQRTTLFTTTTLTFWSRSWLNMTLPICFFQTESMLMASNMKNADVILDNFLV